ncbi:hypothetical protein [Pantoea stewartii]|uniref:hypothetical protein n=1 Tax=Pantoea stewartii TaxID=66269 RepID=UPI0013903077|nr:hypothetical protein [Pantoea stewartii]
MKEKIKDLIEKLAESKAKKNIRKEGLSYLFLFLLIIWLILYIFIPKLLNIKKENIDLLHALLNVGMAITVIVFAFIDRSKAYKKHKGNISEFKGQFISFALAIVPFTSAMTDLSDLLDSAAVISSLVLFTLGVLTVIEITFISRLSDRPDYPANLKRHVAIAIFLFLLSIIFLSIKFYMNTEMSSQG